jgi:carboxylate-amine ligase
MPLEAFHHVSELLTMGVELELQPLDTLDYDLTPRAQDLLRVLTNTPAPGM